MKQLFDTISEESAVIITKKYSTSFSIAVRLLAPSIRQAIYNIYGFVRVADEIVDSFEGYNQAELMRRFEDEYAFARDNGISSNPVINAFQKTVKEYSIDEHLVQSFLDSMRTDLTKQVYMTQEETDQYIYGSADVVGLMCLKVFVDGDPEQYNALKVSAMQLGSAFQKVNFLRDMKQDYESLSRTYFPNIDIENISQTDLNKLIVEIKENFKEAHVGIKSLPKKSRLGVYVAYRYYLKLLKKIEQSPVKVMTEGRVRVSDFTKTVLLIKSFIKYRLKLV